MSRNPEIGNFNTVGETPGEERQPSVPEGYNFYFRPHGAAGTPDYFDDPTLDLVEEDVRADPEPDILRIMTDIERPIAPGAITAENLQKITQAQPPKEEGEQL